MKNLAECEGEMAQVEKRVERYRLQQLGPMYAKRSQCIGDIPGFWSIVLSQHSDFANYIRASDFKYIDAITNIEIKWLILEDAGADPRDLAITFTFKQIEGDLAAQTVTKTFKVEHDTSKRLTNSKSAASEEDDLDQEAGFLTSTAVEIQWPKAYNEINPDLVKDRKSAEGKRNYRNGMKSFFGWFRWTGLKPRKEFPNGDGLANLFNEDIYPYCVNYYTQAQRDVLDESDDGSDSDGGSDEPLDLGPSGEEEEQDGDGNSDGDQHTAKRRRV